MTDITEASYLITAYQEERGFSNTVFYCCQYSTDSGKDLFIRYVQVVHLHLCANTNETERKMLH